MPVAANLQNVPMFIGTDQTIQDTVFQADGVTPQNLTNWTVRMTVYAYGDNRQIFIVKDNSITGGITIPLPTNGTLFISFLSSDTAGMFPGQYQYRIERIDPGFDAVPTYGLLTLIPK